MSGREENKFKCTECVYATSHKSNLIRHQLTHSGEKPFQCDQCRYASAQVGALLRHKRTHSGEKPFQCDQCRYASAQMGALIAHKRTHSGEKPFHCDQCRYASAQKSHLIAHKRTHSGDKPFQCDQCSYASAQKSHLIAHKRTHSGVKPFQCDQCSYASTQKGPLIAHKRTHSGDKPFQCDQCSYASATKRYLISHKRARHSQVEKTHKCPCGDRNCATNKTLQGHLRVHGPFGNQIGASNSHKPELACQSQPRQFDSYGRHNGGRYCLVLLRRVTKEQIKSLSGKPLHVLVGKAEVSEPDADTATINKEMVSGSECLNIDVSSVKREPFFDFIDQFPDPSVVKREESEYCPVGDSNEGVPTNPDTPIKIELTPEEKTNESQCSF